VPLWVDPSKAQYFVTVGCEQRRKNQLAHPKVADGIVETVKFRSTHGVWYTHLVMIMPDHVHLLLSFPDTEMRVQIVVSKMEGMDCEDLEDSVAARLLRTSASQGRKLSGNG